MGKKQDLKKLALLGLASSAMMASAGVHAQEKNANDNGIHLVNKDDAYLGFNGMNDSRDFNGHLAGGSCGGKSGCGRSHGKSSQYQSSCGGQGHRGQQQASCGGQQGHWGQQQATCGGQGHWGQQQASCGQQGHWGQQQSSCGGQQGQWGQQQTSCGNQAQSYNQPQYQTHINTANNQPQNHNQQQRNSLITTSTQPQRTTPNDPTKKDYNKPETQHINVKNIPYYNEGTIAEATRPNATTGTTATTKQTPLTEATLQTHLNTEGKATYQKLSPEGKALALKLANQDTYKDKNEAVKAAQKATEKKNHTQTQPTPAR